MNKKHIGGISGIALLAFFTASVVSAATSGTLMPTSDGFYTQWTPKTGSSHFVLVDETTCNGTTDHNSTNTIGNRDSYGVSLTSIPNGAVITAIAIKPCASRANAGGTNPVMNVFYRFNGVNSADSGSYSLTGTTPVELSTTTFSSLSHVKSSGSTLETGAVLTSSTKGARLSRLSTVITYSPLTAPSNLSGLSTSTSMIRLTWDDNSTVEDGFNLERSTDVVNWTAVATTSAGVTTYFDLGLSEGTTYYHRVRTFNSGAYSNYSNYATTTTIIALPTNLTATASSTNVILNWTDNSGVEIAYSIERGLSTSSMSQIATTSPNVTTYIDPGLANGTYYYKVRALGLAGESAYSNTVSATIDAPPSIMDDLPFTAHQKTGTTTQSFSYTVPSGGASKLFVAIFATGSQLSAGLPSAMLNGQSLTIVTATGTSNRAGWAMGYLTNPTSGQFSVSYTDGSGGYTLNYYVMTLHNAAQTNPVDDYKVTYNGNITSSQTTNVTTTVGKDLLLGTGYYAGPNAQANQDVVVSTYGTSESQTYFFRDLDFLGPNTGSQKNAASSAGAESMTTNWSLVGDIDQVVLAIKPAQ